MLVEDLKKSRLLKNTQLVIFSKTGDVIETCNVIFDLAQKNVFEEFEFLEIAINRIVELSFDEPFIIPKVNINGKKDIYDFVFEKYQDNYLLTISNEKKVNAFIKKLQQERNEALVKLSKR